MCFFAAGRGGRGGVGRVDGRDGRSDGDGFSFLDRDPQHARAGGGESLVALSVSSSKSGSPARTRAPSALCQRERIPSEIDSPTAGTVTGTEGMASSLLAWPALAPARCC